MNNSKKLIASSSLPDNSSTASNSPEITTGQDSQVNSYNPRYLFHADEPVPKKYRRKLKRIEGQADRAMACQHLLTAQFGQLWRFYDSHTLEPLKFFLDTERAQQIVARHGVERPWTEASVLDVIVLQMATEEGLLNG